MGFLARRLVLRLFKYYSKRLNRTLPDNICMTLYCGNSTGVISFLRGTFGPPSGSTWNKCMTYSISYNKGSSILKGRPKGVPYKGIICIHFSNFPDSGS